MLAALVSESGFRRDGCQVDGGLCILAFKIDGFTLSFLGESVRRPVA